jgi:hypothetical protein
MKTCVLLKFLLSSSTVLNLSPQTTLQQQSLVIKAQVGIYSHHTPTLTTDFESWCELGSCKFRCWISFQKQHSGFSLFLNSSSKSSKYESDFTYKHRVSTIYHYPKCCKFNSRLFNNKLSNRVVDHATFPSSCKTGF